MNPFTIGGGARSRHRWVIVAAAVLAVSGAAVVVQRPDMVNLTGVGTPAGFGLLIAGLVLGARVPIILTSRADNVRTRMASCAVAMLLAHNRREKEPIQA